MTSKTVGGVTTNYTYDLAGQLASESRPGYSCSYTYDANGNRLTKTLNGVTETYTYDDGDKMLTAGSKSYGYDAAGRTTSVTNGSSVTNLSYDWESRLTSLSGATTASYTYNGLDTRVSKIEGGVTNTYVRDGVGVTAPVIRDTFASYTPGTSEKRGTTTTFLHSGLKNAEMQTDTAKAVSATKQYDAFGNLTSSTGTWQGAFGYAGGFGYQEDASGLKLLGHRYYDSSTGRFLTRDPAKDGRNWFVYCDNNPIGRADPSGFDWHNPTQVRVDPRFGGTVIAMGEPGLDKPQVTVTLGGGQQTNPKMDVDLIVVNHPDGSVAYYFLAGRKNKLWTKDRSDGDVVTIDAYGHPQSPPGFLILGFDPWTPIIGPKFMDDLEEALGRPTPKDMSPKPWPGKFTG